MSEQRTSIEPESKTCTICGTLFFRRIHRGGKSGESKNQFAQRVTCRSESCKTEWKRRNAKPPHRKRDDDRTGQSQHCQYCGEAFFRRQAESPARWVARKTCGKIECRSLSKRIAASGPTRYCEVCDAPIIRRDNEDSQNFLRRRTCSRECGYRLLLFKRDRTSIEKEVHIALAQLGVSFYDQIPIEGYIADFFLPGFNAVLECQGDYYHANPRIYDLDAPDLLTPRQQKQITRDQGKRLRYESQGYRVIEVWEEDIRKFGALIVLEYALWNPDAMPYLQAA